MSGLEAIRWKQKYPEEIAAIIGLDMAVPAVYLGWKDNKVEKRIRTMKTIRTLKIPLQEYAAAYTRMLYPAPFEATTR